MVFFFLGKHKQVDSIKKPMNFDCYHIIFQAVATIIARRIG